MIKRHQQGTGKKKARIEIQAELSTNAHNDYTNIVELLSDVRAYRLSYASER